MKVSGVAIGQWNDICKKKEGAHRTKYKLHRAIVLGRVVHVYVSKDYIVRYHDLNILVSHIGLIMMVWRDQSRPNVVILDEDKDEYDAKTTNGQNISNANSQHRENLINNKSF